MKIWFLSDLHLKSDQEPQAEKLIRFLSDLKKKTEPQDVLFLLGDIFDLWVGGHQVFYKKYQKVVDAISELKKTGMRIIFIEGNHDLHIEPFWQKKLGIEVYVEAEYFNFDGFIIRAEHGDKINLEDKAYLRLRFVLRHPLVKFLAQKVPGAFWVKIGSLASQTSRGFSEKARSREGEDQKMIQLIRAHALRSYQEQPFDLIVSGHMHVQDQWCFEQDGKKITSVNLGSWFDKQEVLFVEPFKNVSWVKLPLVL